MVDTQRTLTELQSLLADNTSQAISAQDVRDLLVSVYPNPETFAAQAYNGGNTAMNPQTDPGTNGPSLWPEWTHIDQDPWGLTSGAEMMDLGGSLGSILQPMVWAPRGFYTFNFHAYITGATDGGYRALFADLGDHDLVGGDDSYDHIYGATLGYQAFTGEEYLSSSLSHFGGGSGITPMGITGFIRNINDAPIPFIFGGIARGATGPQGLSYARVVLTRLSRDLSADTA